MMGLHCGKHRQVIAQAVGVTFPRLSQGRCREIELLSDGLDVFPLLAFLHEGVLDFPEGRKDRLRVECQRLVDLGLGAADLGGPAARVEDGRQCGCRHAPGLTVPEVLRPDGAVAGRSGQTEGRQSVGDRGGDAVIGGGKARLCGPNIRPTREHVRRKTGLR